MQPRPRVGGSSAYRGCVQSKAVSILVYSSLRIALFVAAWLAFALLTPIKGIWAIVAGILVSGAISLVVLNRQREKVGRAAEIGRAHV